MHVYAYGQARKRDLHSCPAETDSGIRRIEGQLKCTYSIDLCM